MSTKLTMHVSAKVTRNINLMRRLSWFLPKHVLFTFYNAYILPSLDYYDVVWQKDSTELERLQNYAWKVILKGLELPQHPGLENNLAGKPSKADDSCMYSSSGLQMSEWHGSRLLGSPPDSIIQRPLSPH